MKSIQNYKQLNSAAPRATRLVQLYNGSIELGSIIKLSFLSWAWGLEEVEGICNAALVANLAEKSWVYMTFTYAHPKFCLCYTTVICSRSLLSILVKVKHQHLYLWLFNVLLLFIMFLNSPSSLFVNYLLFFTTAWIAPPPTKIL